MKKIAVLCNYNITPARIGGMDRFFVLFDQEIKKKGHAIDWYFKNVEPSSFHQTLTISNAKGKNAETYFYEATKANANTYDFIITHFVDLCNPIFKKIKVSNKKSSIVVVDHNPRPIKGFSFKKRIKKRINSFLFSRYIDKFVGVSQYTVDHILKDYGVALRKKTKLVYNGIDVNVFKKRETTNDKRFIVASHLRESKGIQDLILALSLLKQELLKDVIIDIYGDGPYKDKLQQLIQQNSLESIIFFKGNSAKLNEIFSDYSYMIQPTYMECFSLSILESLSANVPVITTQVGGNTEVVKHEKNGFIYSAGNIEKLSKILSNVLSGRKSIVENTSKLIEDEFNIQKMVKNHIEILDI